MKETKFRVWDRDLKAFREYTGTNYEGQSINKLFQDKSLIFLQYIGIQDKNGVEIYEGNIVESTSNFIDLETEEPTGEICIAIYEIIYLDGNAQFTTKSIKSQYPNGYINRLGIRQEQMSKYYEVIGNIYENPELLKR